VCEKFSLQTLLKGILDVITYDSATSTIVDLVDDAATAATAPSKSTITAFCLWNIFDRERSATEWMAEDELQTCNWLEGGAREAARA
jgi:hypothetical protein